MKGNFSAELRAAGRNCEPLETLNWDLFLFILRGKEGKDQ